MREGCIALKKNGNRRGTFGGSPSAQQALSERRRAGEIEIAERPLACDGDAVRARLAAASTAHRADPWSQGVQCDAQFVTPLRP